VSALFIVVAILDHFLQKYLHIKKLKMSKDEVKREHKEREGDPHLKGRRRQLQMEMASDDMAMKIRESTIILTQGKQLALAVYYEMGKTLLPVITVKGKSRIAEKVVEMAKKHNIPVYEDAALTRALYKKIEQDNYISSEFIQPVAEKLRKAMGLEG
jgi:type III secretion protein U